jgi:hypothetical protein
MGVRLYVIATNEQLERFTGAPLGTIAQCIAIDEACSQNMRCTPDQDHQMTTYQAAQVIIKALDVHGAYALSSHCDPFGYALIHREDPEGTYGGDAKGARAVRALLLQRERYPAENPGGFYSDDEWTEMRLEYRAKCDRVALACADGRLGGVWWG